jgi:enamine deaminase RidA (YjgF/YER057c/UK114 family)
MIQSAKSGGGAVGDAAAQWRAILANIKSDLEELGSSLEYLIRMTFFVKGPFPNGGVLSSPNFRLDVLDAFFAEHCPKHCSTNNPPPSEVIGVAALAHPDLVVEIVAVAALPD